MPRPTHPFLIAACGLIACTLVTTALAGPQQPTFAWVVLDAEDEPAPGQSPAVVVAQVTDDARDDAEAIVNSLELGVMISLGDKVADVDDLDALEARVLETGKSGQLHVGWFSTSLGRFDVVCRSLDEHVGCRAYAGKTVLAMPLSAISWE